MADTLNQSARSVPWNAHRIIGSKPPLKPKHIWAIRQRLMDARRVRDLALFNCAIDSKLRGCDLVALRVSDLAPAGTLRQRATIVQRKTHRPVPFELTEPTRQALAVWLEKRGGRADDWLFPSRTVPGAHMSTRQYARLLDRWLRMIDLEPRAYGTHTIMVLQAVTSAWRMAVEASRLDAQGIQIVKAGGVSKYPWPEIERVRKIVISRGRGSDITAMQIQLKGHFYTPDDKSDSIDPQQFGVTNENFASMVQAGIRTWRTGAAAA